MGQNYVTFILYISYAKILVNFSVKIYESNFIKQHSESIMVSNY